MRDDQQQPRDIIPLIEARRPEQPEPRDLAAADHWLKFVPRGRRSGHARAGAYRLPLLTWEAAAK